MLQDQTDPNWLGQPDELGTGIFLVPDVTKAVPRAVNKMWVQTITYTDCQIRGTLTVAFKWVPNRVASFIDMQSKPCVPHTCVDTCVEPGCVCKDGTCQ
jgi:hypothetical protein